MTDWFKEFDKTKYLKKLEELLDKKYILKYEKENPDYLIYGVYGCLHLNIKYQKSIKILWITENTLPNFDEADYVMGFAHISYLDRYFRYPSIIRILGNFKNKDFKILRNDPIINRRKKFCAAVISNTHSKFSNFRIKFIEELSKYKKVDFGGSYNNSFGEKVKNKVKFLSSYRFSIAMENSEGDGYLSEKIIDSFKAGTIPIYYGDYMLDEYFNPNSFIIVRDLRDINRKIKIIKEIDNNDELYLYFLKQDVLIDNDIVQKREMEKKDFLSHIFEQDKEEARRIDYTNTYKFGKCSKYVKGEDNIRKNI